MDQGPHLHDPHSYSLLQYAGVVALSAWGGIVNYWRKLKAGGKFSVTELIGEIATSGFSGIITFYLCEAVGMDPLITAATVGIAGHMGGRTIVLLENALCEKISKRFKLTVSCKDPTRD